MEPEAEPQPDPPSDPPRAGAGGVEGTVGEGIVGEGTVGEADAAAGGEPAAGGGAFDLRPPPPQVVVAATVAPRVHFALEQNGLAVVRRLRVEHVGERPLEDVVATVTLGGDRAEPLVLRLDRLDPGGVWEVDDPPLRLDPERLRAQEEREAVELRVDVAARRGPVGATSERVELLAWNEWPGLGFAPELTAAFALPNHPSLDAVLTRAAEHLEAATGSPSLDGYQTPDRASAIAAAVWAALAERGLVYAEPPASFERDGQKVRLPHRVLTGGLATCLDLALLYAAALEQAGLHPLIVFERGHASTGVWLREESFPEAVIEDPLRVRKRVQVGAIALLETTGLAQRPAQPFATARETGLRRLDDLARYECAVDVRAARRLGIRPLATRITDAGEVLEVGAPVRAALAAERAPSTPNVPGPAPARAVPAARPEPVEPAERRLAGWKRRLLDLSLRNRLLNFRETKRTIPLAGVDIAALEDALARGAAFTLASDDERPRGASLATRGAPDPRRAYLAEEFAAGRLRAALPSGELERRLLETWRGARLAVEESGANPLYLALAFLHWRDPESPERELRAPLLLLPLELERLPAGRGWRLTAADDEPRLNDSLLEKLGTHLGLDPAPLAALPADDDGLDVAAILKTWREALLDRAGWDIVEEAWLGLFSFAKLVMWRDLEARRDELLEARAVRFLVERPDEPFDDGAPFPDPRRIDADYAPLDLHLPLDADSSQLAAVLAATAGRTFVLEGPPGTGKSQTIANLVAQALGQGQRVLFVAEKRAALEVVQRRLEQVGLGPFCLELHSNKIAKRAVVEQLGRALDAAGADAGDPRAPLAEPLANVRDELAHHAHALHAEGPLARSLFDAIGRLLELDDAPRVELRPGAAADLDAERCADLLRRAEDLARAAGLAEPGAGHPLDPVRATELGPAARAAVESGAAETRRALGALLERAAGPVAALGFATGPDPSPSGAELDATAAAARLLAAGPDPGAALLEEPHWPAARARLEDALGRARATATRRASLLDRWDAALLARDLDALATRVDAAARRSVLTRWWARRALRAELAPLRRAGAVPGLAELAADLREARAVLAEEAALAASDAARILGAGWGADADALARSRARVALADRLRALLAAVGEADDPRVARLRSRWIELGGPRRDRLSDGAPLRRELDALDAARSAFEDAWGRLATTLALDVAAVRGERDERALGPAVTAFLDALREAGARLRDWCLWQAARAAAAPTELAPLVDAIDRGELQPARAAAACERSLLAAWVVARIEADDALRRFHGLEHDGRVSRFERLDRGWLEATRRALAARLAAGVPAAGDATSANSEVGVLQRERRKKRGHLPVRRLVERLPHLLPRLARCVLASPLSTAQFLDAGLARFDLVVFDEASQIPVWDGVGAMARGRAAVVVGDSKQLPPTSFFALGDDDEADLDPDYEELESLLDECVAARLPRLHLGWHYRSRHESLIAFSNARYYDGRLATFPAPGGVRPGLGLTWRRVEDGSYDRAGTRTNRGEAAAIVARAIALLEASAPADDAAPSIGIVTFSLPQQRLVEELLDRARAERPDLEPRFDTSRVEPLFVKNLENVQGDERDVILLGVGYGPDGEGRMSMNLGPLNRAGGERRLNVAITRARRSLEVFTSFAPEALDLRRTGAAGVRDLRSFLEFAASGHLAAQPADDPASDSDRGRSGVAARLVAALTERGHRVAERVGCSTSRVDVAIAAQPAGAEEAFDLGLLLDGVGYASGATVRDRDRLRAQVLRGLGWNLLHVWTLDVFSDLEGQLRRIEAALAAVRAGRPAAPPPSPGRERSDGDASERERPAAGSAPRGEAPPGDDPSSPSVAGADDPPRYRSAAAAPARAAEPVADGPGVYTVAKLRDRRARRERFHGDDETPRVAAAAREVVAAEAPVALELAARRVAEAWGLRRITERVQDRVRAALETLPAGERPLERDGFLWPTGASPEDHRTFRTSPPGRSERSPRELPVEEVAAALAHALAQNLALPVDDLLRETAQLFGFTRLGSLVEARLRAGLALLEARGGCTLDDAHVRGT